MITLADINGAAERAKAAQHRRVVRVAHALCHTDENGPCGCANQPDGACDNQWDRAVLVLQAADGFTFGQVPAGGRS